jgi:hypothetical protein
MKKTLDWHIGKSAHGKERLDTAPQKAYFFWKHDGVMVDSAELSLAELDQFIAALDEKDPFREEYASARTDLIRSLEAKHSRE